MQSNFTDINDGLTSSNLTQIINLNSMSYNNEDVNFDDVGNFATDSWFKIFVLSRYGQTNPYQLGDTKSMTIGEDTFTARICDISERYDLVNGSGKNKMVIETVECLNDKYYNTTGNTSTWGYSNYLGWGGCCVRYILENTILPTLPIKDFISRIKIPYSNVFTNTNGNQYRRLEYSNDKLFIPDVYEVIGVNTNGDNIFTTTQFGLYLANNNNSFRIKYPQNDNTTPVRWWERTPLNHYCIHYLKVNANGTGGQDDFGARPQLYVSVFFAI